MDLSLKLARPAENTPIPETLGELWELLAQNAQVVGSQITEGSGALPMQLYRRQGEQETELTGEDSVLWIETNGENRPIAMNVYSGDAWKNFGDLPKGTTDERNALSDMKAWEFFYDTDIQALLTWNTVEWMTVEGSPGSTKFVHAESEALALSRNPGWIIFDEGKGRTPVGVNAGDEEDFDILDEDDPAKLYQSSGNKFGQKSTPVQVPHLPPHQFLHNDRSIVRTAQMDSDDDGSEVNAHYEDIYRETSVVGAGESLETRDPSLTVFWLIKKGLPEIDTKTWDYQDPLPDAGLVPHEDEVTAARIVLWLYEQRVTNANSGINKVSMYTPFETESGNGRNIVESSEIIYRTFLRYGALTTGTGLSLAVESRSLPLSDIQPVASVHMPIPPTVDLGQGLPGELTKIRNSTFYTP